MAQPVEAAHAWANGRVPRTPVSRVGSLLVAEHTGCRDGGVVAQQASRGLLLRRCPAPLLVDLAFYLGCLAFAATTAVTSEFYGHRVWGNFGALGYGLAAAHTSWLLLDGRTRGQRHGWWRSRWCGLGAISVCAMVAPLAVLIVRRLSGADWLTTPNSWSAQPEVWVIERSASLLLEQGTPYVDIAGLARPPGVNDYTPYGPVMALFGLPRAVFGGTPLANALTDARLVFAIVACLCAWASVRLLGGRGVPVRAAQLVVACPLTALTWAVAGPDLAVLGLLVLGAVLAVRHRPAWSAAVVALVVSAKLTALPATVVLAMFVAARLGGYALARFIGTWTVVSAAVNLPVLLANPGAFVENVLRFPAGLGAVKSPATSPLPGHLIASIGPAGRTAALVLLAAAAVAIAAWLLLRPPITGSDAMLRTAVSLGVSTLLTPATRFGYLVYPVVLIGVMLWLRRQEPTPPRRAATSSWS